MESNSTLTAILIVSSLASYVLTIVFNSVINNPKISEYLLHFTRKCLKTDFFAKLIHCVFLFLLQLASNCKFDFQATSKHNNCQRYF